MLGLGARDVVHGVPGERERSSARHAVREVVVPAVSYTHLTLPTN